MPLFEYRCHKCGKRFSFLVGVSAEKASLRCPRCGGAKATKLISRIARVGRGEDDDFDDDFDAEDEDLGGEDEDEDLDDLDED